MDSLYPDIEKSATRARSAALVRRPRVNKNSPRPILTPPIPRPRVDNDAKPVSMHTICLIDRLDDSDNMVFRCRISGCHGTFGRWPDFMRHYNGAHAVEKKVYWCPSGGCMRSEAGNNPFPRKDKMMDHVRQAHGILLGRGRAP
jgi:uncharacterized C2H2 Zn-finger protein